MSKLKKILPKEHWDKIHSENGYYDYMDSSYFIDLCYKYIVEEIISLSSKLERSIRLLELGCSHSTILNLLPYEHQYTGFDISEIVIQENKNKWKKRKNSKFICTDFDGYLRDHKSEQDIILSGNCLIYIKPEKMLEFINDFILGTKAKYFIVYEISRVRTDMLKEKMKLLNSGNFYINMLGLIEAKRKRKIEVYEIGNLV